VRWGGVGTGAGQVRDSEASHGGMHGVRPVERRWWEVKGGTWQVKGARDTALVRGAALLGFRSTYRSAAGDYHEHLPGEPGDGV
jgi:hypothetical protein